jgi:Glycogen recognition site of AMP-activated protein kinase
MFEQPDDIVERVIQELRRPVAINPELDARVLQTIATSSNAPPRPAQPARRFRWIGPAGAWLAAAAAVAALVITRPWSHGGTHSASTFQFVFTAPQAASVALVGDFNDWDPKRSPMRTANGVWATAVQLTPGRYRYAFLVNGVEWRADPAAPTAKDDEFGTPSSVVTVGGSGS